MFRLTSVLNKLASLPAKLNGAKRPSRPKSIPLHLEALETRMVPALVVNHPGGAVIPNVQVETVYYGQAWTNANDANNPQLKQQANDMDKFFADITGSDYVAGLSEYTGVKYWGTTATAAAPGVGQFLRRDMANDALTGGTILTNGQIQAMLKREINTFHLDQPDANKLYVVMMPPNFRTNVVSGGGYHSSFDLWGSQVHYAVIESSFSGLTAVGQTNLESDFQRLTEVASHELVEAITDAEPRYHPAWSGANGEIGDVTQHNLPINRSGAELNPTSGAALSNVDGYLVQKYWSEKHFASVAPGGVDYQPLGRVPDGLSSQHFTLTSLTQGTKTSVQLQITLGTITKPTYGYGRSTFSGTWTNASGVTENVVGSLTANGQTVVVNIYSSRTGQNLFTGALSTPNGNWKQGVEMTGTANGVSYFGVQDGSQETSLSGYGGWGNGPTLPIPKRHPLLLDQP